MWVCVNVVMLLAGQAIAIVMNTAAYREALSRM